MSWLSSAAGKLSGALSGGLKQATKKLSGIAGTVGGVVGGVIAGPGGAAVGSRVAQQAVRGLLPKSVPMPNPLAPPKMAPTPTLPNMPKAPIKPPTGKPGTSLIPYGTQPQQQTGIGQAWTWIDQNLAQGWLPGGVLPKGYGPGTNAVTGGGVQVVNGQIPMVTDPITHTGPRAPHGYVLVKMPDGSIKAVLKEVAYALGLKKRPQKRGGVSAKEIRTARKVQSLITSLTVARHPRTPIRKKARR